MSDQFSMYDAAYLLGALTPADRAAYEVHLADCHDCRRGLNQLAGMPGLLAGLTADQAGAAGEGVPDVPATLLPRLLAEVQRTRFRRRMTTSLVGVAAAVAVSIALVVGLHGSPPGEQSAAAHLVAQQMVPVSANVPIRATATLQDKGWGTRVVVTCVYRGAAGEWEDAPIYTLVVTDKSGATQQIAAWGVKAGAPIVVDGSTSVPRSQIASVQVRNPDDQPILTLQL